MKLKAPTVFLVGIAAVLGLVVFAEFQGGDRRTSSDENAQPLFTFEEDDVQAFTVETPLESVSFERDAEGVWKMLSPEEFTANDASVAFLLNLLATGESDRRLIVSVDELDDFGLDAPQTTIDVVLQDDTTHQLVLGDFDFSQQSIYARIDPEAEAEGTPESIDVSLVSTSFDAAVNRSIEDWQQIEPEEPEAPLEELEDTENLDDSSSDDVSSDEGGGEAESSDIDSDDNTASEPELEPEPTTDDIDTVNESESTESESTEPEAIEPSESEE